MKSQGNIVIISLAFVLIMYSSCVSIYFNQPQPTDSKDLEKIPRNLRGIWVQNKDTVFVGKNVFRQIEWESNAMSKQEIDSNGSIVIRESKIYDIENDSLTGYNFVERNDSVFIDIPGEFRFQLGEYAKLRVCTNKYYLVNIRKDSIWWDTYLVEKQKNKILVRYPNSMDIKILESTLNMSNIEQQIPEDEEAMSSLVLQDYWCVGMKSKELFRFINAGGFSDTVLVLDKKYRIK